MGYWKENGEWADADDVVFGDGALAATRDGEAMPTDRGTLRLSLNVTAIVSTPSLVVAVETSFDKVTWTAVGTAFAAATAVSTQRKVFTGLDRYVRVKETLSGGTLTRKLSGEFV